MKLGSTVAELLDRISSAELTEWIAYSTLEPFGAEADYLGHAITSATVANAAEAIVKAQGSKSPMKQHKVSEFMPNFEKQNQTPDEMLQVAEMFTAVYGGADLREDDNG